MHMNGDEKSTYASQSPLNPEKWFGQLVAAVILAEGIWRLLASLTSYVLVPLLAKFMDGDPQSPSYLGNGEFNVPALFKSFLAFCLSGIASALLYGLSRRKPAPVRVKTMRVVQKVSQPPAGSLSIMAPQDPLAAETPPAVTSTPTAPIQQTPILTPPVPAPPELKPTPPPTVAPSKPTKPKAPKEVYYNLVGEPINPTEDDPSR
jgi:hypothetical protein